MCPFKEYDNLIAEMENLKNLNEELRNKLLDTKGDLQCVLDREKKYKEGIFNCSCWNFHFIFIICNIKYCIYCRIFEWNWQTNCGAIERKQPNKPGAYQY